MIYLAWTCFVFSGLYTLGAATMFHKSQDKVGRDARRDSILSLIAGLLAYGQS